MDVYSARNFLSRPIEKLPLNNCQKKRKVYKTNNKHQEGLSEFIRQSLSYQSDKLLELLEWIFATKNSRH